MATLTLWKYGEPRSIHFSAPCELRKVFEEHSLSIDHPCGGIGKCAKCAVTVSGLVSEPNQSEIAAGVRLSCQVKLLGDAEVWLPDAKAMEQIELSGVEYNGQLNPMRGEYGAAIDIGSTTLALKLYDLHKGRCISNCSMENPQRAVAADVMGRIQAALSGEAEKLQDQIHRAINYMMNKACEKAGVRKEKLEALVVTGNTTMLYLLTGHNTAPLATAPFAADSFFDEYRLILDVHSYLPPCIHAFVGADISCAVLASGMCRSKETSILCDIGTNGEIALWKDGKLYVTSTAAGPAFEGAGISCGCGSIKGAIDKVWLNDGALQIHTISEVKPVGLCGSGLLDAVAAGLELEQIDESGALESDAFVLLDEVKILQKDIRAVQLAKAAIAAGIETILSVAGVPITEVDKLYIAGGFGSHLNIASAVRIGLIPEALSRKVAIIGNAALAGAGQLLLNQSNTAEIRQIAASAEHINLGGNPVFGNLFIERMILKEYGEAEGIQ